MHDSLSGDPARANVTTLHDLGFLGQGHYAHGTRQLYRAGCGCVPCRSANACYEAARARARAAGPAEALVDAAPARARLLELKAAGIGHRHAAKLAKVSFRTVQRIRNGQSPHIRPAVERAILSIQKPTLAHGTRVNGYQTRHYLESLLREGYAAKALARWLGLRGRQVQLHNRDVKVESALNVERLYQQLTAEDCDQPSV
jgi:hypothetical protein